MLNSCIWQHGYIFNDRSYHLKWDPISNEGTFLGYSINSRVFRVYNKRTKTVMEYVNIIVYDTGDLIKKEEDDSRLSSSLTDEITKCSGCNSLKKEYFDSLSVITTD